MLEVSDKQSQSIEQAEHAPASHARRANTAHTGALWQLLHPGGETVGAAEVPLCLLQVLCSSCTPLHHHV
jgi:hypothetical protein